VQVLELSTMVTAQLYGQIISTSVHADGTRGPRLALSTRERHGNPVPLLWIVPSGGKPSLISFCDALRVRHGVPDVFIPLVAAEQFGVDNLAHVMGIISQPLW
jgi:hypothetical protein